MNENELEMTEPPKKRSALSRAWDLIWPLAVLLFACFCLVCTFRQVRNTLRFRAWAHEQEAEYYRLSEKIGLKYLNGDEVRLIDWETKDPVCADSSMSTRARSFRKPPMPMHGSFRRALAPSSARTAGSGSSVRTAPGPFRRLSRTKPASTMSSGAASAGSRTRIGRSGLSIGQAGGSSRRNTIGRIPFPIPCTPFRWTGRSD